MGWKCLDLMYNPRKFLNQRSPVGHLHPKVPQPFKTKSPARNQMFKYIIHMGDTLHSNHNASHPASATHKLVH